MTRGEEIHKAAEEFAFSDKTETIDYRNAMNDFYYGAKWADEHPNLYNDEKYHTVKVSCLDELYRKAEMYDTFLEKACEWIKNNKHLHKILWFDSLSTDWDKFIREFRKAMEE